MKRASLTIVLLGVLSMEGSRAQQPSDAFTVYGAGTANCASWTEHLSNTNLHSLDLHWVFGFVSAAGLFAGVQLKLDANGVEPFITKYCQEHPQDTITTAAANLVGSVRR